MGRNEVVESYKTPELTLDEFRSLGTLGIDSYKASAAQTSLEFIEKTLGKSVHGLTVLDVGCGSAHYDRFNSHRPPVLTVLMASRGAHVYGIDPYEQENVHNRLVRENGGKFMQLTIESLSSAIGSGHRPFGQRKKFDAVVTQDVIGHNPDLNINQSNADILRYLSAQRRYYLDICEHILKPGGFAFFDWVPSSDNLYERLQQKYYTWQKPEEPRQTLFGRIFGR
jgi:2-polyprenyl-3-methyl-5-hydroxy-6-metoxy-1,4-benzoquinol methylase